MNQKLTEVESLFAITVIFVAHKLATEHLARTQPERSRQEWEKLFKDEAAKLIRSIPPERLDDYLQNRFPQ